MPGFKCFNTTVYQNTNKCKALPSICSEFQSFFGVECSKFLIALSMWKACLSFFTQFLSKVKTNYNLDCVLEAKSNSKVLMSLRFFPRVAFSGVCDLQSWNITMRESEHCWQERQMSHVCVFSLIQKPDEGSQKAAFHGKLLAGRPKVNAITVFSNLFVSLDLLMVFTSRNHQMLYRASQINQENCVRILSSY